jgi:hypothetical protein
MLEVQEEAKRSRRASPVEHRGVVEEADQKGSKAMNTEYRKTQEEEAYRWFFADNEKMLSEAARTIFEEAEVDARKFNLCHNYAYQPFKYDEAMEKMRIAATEITGRDRELLASLWRAALAAAASIDPEDETLVGHKRYHGDYHQYYRNTSEKIERILQEKKTTELREKAAERETKEELGDIPF